jgi:hypothetical protein
VTFNVDIYRGGTLIGRGTVPAGTDWQQYQASVGTVQVTPGETLALAVENPTNPTGIGFWQAVTTSDSYGSGSLTVSNPCAWAQTAHPAFDTPPGDLLAEIIDAS